MSADPWLKKWLLLIKQKSKSGHILELGCGDGRDTNILLSAGCKVIGADLSTVNLAECTKSPAYAKLVQLDHSQSLPFGDYYEMDIDEQGTAHLIFGEGYDYNAPGSIWYSKGQ